MHKANRADHVLSFAARRGDGRAKIRKGLKELPSVFFVVIVRERVKCQYCGNEWMAMLGTSNLGPDGSEYQAMVHYWRCIHPDCLRISLRIENGTVGKTAGKPWERNEILVEYPGPPPEGLLNENGEIPENIYELYRRAHFHSTKDHDLSAFLSRKALEALLNDQKIGIPRDNLSKRIEEYIQRGDGPTYLMGSMHLVREILNFAVHDQIHQEDDTVIPVDKDEAKYCLVAVESLINHHYKRPNEINRMIDRFNIKQRAAGRKELKKPEKTIPD